MRFDWYAAGMVCGETGMRGKSHVVQSPGSFPVEVLLTRHKQLQRVPERGEHHVGLTNVGLKPCTQLQWQQQEKQQEKWQQQQPQQQ